ncbi:imidazolonepropionase-like amidohydrolase [Blastococcus colisei]|uniref:Imidazolonepropionase-like amidohydrolase n=1 Tax=Blastococcus colisei TaxID=1564162 RepID=A0A543PFX3_9ACTN|nr:amidohydrolase family protein [Blastococcus colisei]TQN42978.1 imidazolonepropionase-like amidohydrolase [Blastococcus colisei]
MRAYRADVAFDGERRLPGGALVLVDDGVIVGVESASSPTPDGCPVTDGAALLPGLIDTHVHLCGDSSPRALDQFAELSADQLQAVITTAEEQHLQAGVTTVRDLGDDRWAVVERSRTGDDGPTVVASGPPLTVPGGHCWSMGGVATGPEGLREAVRERVDRGAGVVKIMTSGGVLTPDTDVLACQFSLGEMRAVVDEAHGHGLPVTAHAHGLAAVELAVESGVDGIEHCSCLTHTGARLPPALAERLVEAGTYVCPTVGRVPGVAPPPHVQARLAAIGSTFEDHLVHVVELVNAGITFLAGTDAGIGPSKRHGLVPMAVADLVACGAPATEALASATGLAARACGLQRRTGRLAVGLEADLLLVDGDPLIDVTALQRPRTVVSRGREVPLPRQ